MSTYTTARLQITSEIYAETDFKCLNLTDGKSISKFSFTHPIEVEGSSSQESNLLVADKDGDLVLERRKKGVIEIEHLKSTDLTLVGLQVWRGALLLADYILHNRKLFQNKNVLEVGSGVGLTGIAAGIYSNSVYCTDINLGGILELIQRNVDRNSSLLKSPQSVKVMELDFTCEQFSDKLQNIIDETDIVLAADVIYDDDLTDAFVKTIEKLLQPSGAAPYKSKSIYIALEKRYVFTVTDLESLPPCYEYFLNLIDKLRWTKMWKLECIPIDFAQYFEYERVKELVLLRLSF